MVLSKLGGESEKRSKFALCKKKLALWFVTVALEIEVHGKTQKDKVRYKKGGQVT